jgi:hypothetical protein
VGNDEIEIDDLLREQEETGNAFHVTIERTPDDDERVKITPYRADTGCLCIDAIVVPKQSIETAKRTGETHLCCGKTLQVVEVTFSDAVLGDIFSQIASKPRRAFDAPPTFTSNIPAMQEQLHRHPSQATRPEAIPRRRALVPPFPRESSRGRLANDECFWRCLEEWYECESWARNESDHCFCRNYFKACMGSCGRPHGEFEMCVFPEP